MESFKKALKQAIQEKAEAVRIEDGQHPHLLHFSSEKPLLQLPVMNLADVQALMESLVSNGEPLGETAREGVLAIVNFGELKLIAQLTTPLKLYAFIPPQGNQMHQQIRNQILGPAKPLPSAIDMPSMLPEEPSSMGQFALSPSEPSEVEPATLAPRKSLPVNDDIFSMGSVLSSPVSAPLSSPAAPASQVGKPYIPSFDDNAPVPAYIPGQGIEEERAAQPTVLSRGKPEFSAIPSEVNNLPFDSNLSMPAHLPRGLSDIDSSSNDLDYHYNGSHSSVAPIHNHMPSAPAPSAAPVIHFGAFIPGETIDRGTTIFALDAVLQDMIKRKASDLHLTQGEKMCMRIDGEIVRTGTTNLTESEMKEYLLAIIPPRNMKE